MPHPTRTILITGGTRGLGLATAELFAKSGYALILTYRSDHENADKVRRYFELSGVSCHTVACDFSEEGAPEKLSTMIGEITGSLSVYVHNAAATAFRPLLDIKPHHIQKTFNITVASFIQNVQWIVPMMPSGGAIVTVSGMDTHEAVPHHGLLASAKATLEMLTVYFAHELATKKIRVNGVNPGYLETDSTRKYFGPRFDQVSAFVGSLTPSRERARLEDVASVIEFLASERATWVVGQTIVVDGGQNFSSPASLALEVDKT